MYGVSFQLSSGGWSTPSRSFTARHRPVAGFLRERERERERERCVRNINLACYVRVQYMHVHVSPTFIHEEGGLISVKNSTMCDCHLAVNTAQNGVVNGKSALRSTRTVNAINGRSQTHSAARMPDTYATTTVCSLFTRELFRCND